MMESARPNRYNEIVLDSLYFEEHLPYSLEAFFTRGHSNLASEAHAAFLLEFGLTSEDVPLLRWAGNTDDDFVDVNHHAG